jgi:hypothetical protein
VWTCNVEIGEYVNFNPIKKKKRNWKCKLMQKCIIFVIHYACVSLYSVSHAFAWSPIEGSRCLSVHKAIVRPFWKPNLSRIPSIAFHPVLLLILRGNISFPFTSSYPKCVLHFKVSYQKMHFPCSEYLLRFTPTELSVV